MFEKEITQGSEFSFGWESMWRGAGGGGTRHKNNVLKYYLISIKFNFFWTVKHTRQASEPSQASLFYWGNKVCVTWPHLYCAGVFLCVFVFPIFSFNSECYLISIKAPNFSARYSLYLINYSYSRRWFA